MKLPCIRLLFIFSCLCASFGANAQAYNLDSLKKRIKVEKDDTSRVNTLNDFSWEYYNDGDLTKADSAAKAALTLGHKIGYGRGECYANKYIGLVQYSKGNYSEAMKDYMLSLNMCDELLAKAKTKGDSAEVRLIKLAMSGVYTNIGNVYDDHGNYPEALKYNLRTLAIDEEIGNKLGIAAAYNNIGSTYDGEGNYKEALQYYLKCLDMVKRLGDPRQQDAALGNIGDAYAELGNSKEAMNYLLQALDISKSTDNKSSLDYDYSNLGIIEENLGKFNESLATLDTSLTIAEEINDKYVMCNNYAHISHVYSSLKQFAMARKYADSAMELGRETGTKDASKSAYANLVLIDSATGDYKTAFEDYKKFITYRDSMSNEENTKKVVSEQMQYEFDKKQSEERAEQEKKDAVTAADKHKQQIITASVSVGLLLVLVFSGLLFSRFRVTQRQKKLIEKQKLVVEEQKLLVEQQKAIVDEKNKDITDSIHYASRIQRALLTTEDYISKRLCEYFILFKPRDIVSGDFYWANEVETKDGKRFLICAGDCTGHGVPGAFMSLLNISMLNEASLEKGIHNPATVLDEVRKHIIKALNPDGADSESKDGMDCILCSIDLKNMEMDFACANNPLWIIREGTVIEFKPDKMPVGIQDENMKPFTLQSAELKKGDCIYLFTDGYADQFGGPKGKKFKYKQLEEKLSVISSQPMAEQKRELEKTFEEWKKGHEQTDDVCIIGIRV